MTGDRDAVLAVSQQVARSIERRDLNALRGYLMPDFVHRTPGGDAVGLEAFLGAIAEIPGEIVAVTLDGVAVELHGDGAIASGLQHAQVRVDGELIVDRRAFVDWFVRVGAEWRIRVAVDLPAPAEVQAP